MIYWHNIPVLLAGTVFAITSPPALAQSVSDYAVRVSATVQTNPPRISLSWPADSRATACKLYRKSRDAMSWGAPIALAANATNYVDSNLSVGSAYEYRISKTASNYTGEGYIYAGIEVPPVEPRGKIVLLVDNTHASTLAVELTRLQQDLVGDGWTVLRHDVARTSAVPSVKALIAADYHADPANVRAVFLFGHVPVPYSGNLNPDGHAGHLGAWPADVYYGDMNGVWTDSSVTSTGAGDPRNRNLPGDGKFDQSFLPLDIELQVGRVDLANLPAFSQSEHELLRQYLNKDHNFRHKLIVPARQGLISDHFGVFNGEAFAVNGWRNFAPFFGPTNIFVGDWRNSLDAQSFLWGYGCSPGSYTGAGGIGSTADFALKDLRVVFTMFFGSWFGDWDSPNNFLRAPLAAPGYGLTCVWAGRPHWAFHHMALGETIGFSTRLAQNNSTTYSANTAMRGVHIALMGDPTLRMHPVATPSDLTVTRGASNSVELSWHSSPEAVAGYRIYRATNAAGPFTPLTTGFVTDTNYTDFAVTSNVYMLRAVKLETTPSGSYYNLSQGIFGILDGTSGAPGNQFFRLTKP